MNGAFKPIYQEERFKLPKGRKVVLWSTASINYFTWTPHKIPRIGTYNKNIQRFDWQSNSLTKWMKITIQTFIYEVRIIYEFTFSRAAFDGGAGSSQLLHILKHTTYILNLTKKYNLNLHLEAFLELLIIWLQMFTFPFSHCLNNSGNSQRISSMSDLTVVFE